MGDNKKTEDLEDVDGGSSANPTLQDVDGGEDSSVADWVTTLVDVDGGSTAAGGEADPLDDVDGGNNTGSNTS